ncbi:MAG: radical SAM protein [Lachnospiraceae bacterium]|nr:radical SAM protein [Lachnospiraceae bacterium]
MLNSSKYFRVSVTDKCNLSCFFCHKEGNDSECADELSPKELQLVCKIAYEMGFQKFKLTGGEPTIRNDICTIISLLSKLNLPDLSMITNGSLLSEQAKDLWDAGLRRLNVTLNTLDQERFQRIQTTRQVPVESILHGLEMAQSVGFKKIKINFVYFDEDSERDLEELLIYAKESGLTLVVLPALQTQSYYTLDYLYNKIRTLGIVSECLISDSEGIRKRLISLTSGASVLLRLDELVNQKPYIFCDKCLTRENCREGIFPVRLSANGELIPCMASREHRISIRSLLTNQNVKGIMEAFATIGEWCLHNE